VVLRFGIDAAPLRACAFDRWSGRGCCGIACRAWV